MNEELQTALTEVINTTLSAKDFLLAEVPDVVHQLLLWHGVASFLYFCVGVIGIIVFLWYRKYLCEWTKEFDKEYHSYDAPLHGFMWVIVGVCVLISMGIIRNNMEWLQIWIAPKVWLIEYAANLVK